MRNKFEKFKGTFLALVCFISGIIVCFEWMGHDKGQRFYSMFKRPEFKEVEVVKMQRVPLIVSDDLTIVAINRNYRDTMIKISGMEYNSYESEDNFNTIQRYIDESLNFVNTVVNEEK